jgi:hypothetical protein
MKFKVVSMMNESKIRQALEILSEELQKRNITATIWILGSVALMFNYSGIKRVTVDIDVICDTPAVVSIAESLAGIRIS